MKVKLLSGVATVAVLALALTGCGGGSSSGGTSAGGASDGGSAAAKTIKVGFAQTGSESGWRAANTKSMKEAFSKEKGFDLVFNAADNDPAAQIAAVRSFISQGVDAIVIAPIVSDGWDDVLKEAQSAKIPVILEDRTVSASPDLYAAWVGDDFKAEGETAGKWAASTLGTADTNMVVLEGTTGSAPANDRAEGFASAIAGTKIKTIASQTGDFTRDGGKKVMEGFLQKYGVKGINLVYAHNDDMALGAIEAIEAAGGKPGTDIKIVSIDAVRDGMQALIDGKINYIVECNPLLGDQAAELVKKVVAGEPVEKVQFAKDSAFDKDAAVAALPTRAY
ncbi:ABC transporter substrate-binding protein [Kineosporia sp. A_224]|uniref:ABC transporter substrate-binding protein n=1 Tax=Kineosporia sp. A_224 TaxID=1962180 RepID=UPI000B4AB4AB|nr:ABC transporter substrate-binding protein [Kineosporia sp. A_224]